MAGAGKLDCQEISSKRYFQWTTKVSSIEEARNPHNDIQASSSSSSSSLKKQQQQKKKKNQEGEAAAASRRRRKVHAVSVAVSVLTSFSRTQAAIFRPRLLLGTLFGTKRGHVHFLFQRDAKSHPTLFLELATPITGLVHEMGSGSVRIALECDKKGSTARASPAPSLLEEPLWRTYCNGNRFGFATRLQCGEKEWRILKAVEPISMGAGVLPQGEGGGEEEEEVIYMRARFERVVGNKDSEAFYMINPDSSNATPELCVYFLRI